MPNSIDEARVLVFGQNLNFLYQQKTQRLRKFIGQEKSEPGKMVSFPRLGLVNPTKRTNRNQPTQFADAAHSNRWAAPNYYDVFLPVDPIDLDRVIIDPKSAYPQQINAGLNRAVDAEIYAPQGVATQGGMRGAALTGESGTGTPAALPAGQKIAHGGTGLTLAKILSAASLLNAAEADMEGRFAVINSAGLEDLLGIQQLTSSDYNAVKLLMTGEINTFMGFQWSLYNFVAETAVYYAIFGQRMAMGLAIPGSVNGSVDKRPDLSNTWQCSGSVDVGAVRVIDEGIVEVAFQ